MAKGQTKEQLISAKQARQNAFLKAYAEAGTISAAAKAARITRRLHFKWMKEPEYAEKFCEAQEMAHDKLEQEARRRAVEGWTEPIFYEGVHVGDKPKYSDQLLTLLLKGALPDKYRDRYENVGEPEKHINYNIDLTQLSDEELKTLEEMADKLGG